ncbi:MAG: trypsin-like peptidase domain-containing protein [Chloroflexi bacterium]|nr:trypsin-like peptidase domain-containing protein [Chloroflexota bacterium]
MKTEPDATVPAIDDSLPTTFTPEFERRPQWATTGAGAAPATAETASPDGAPSEAAWDRADAVAAAAAASAAVKASEAQRSRRVGLGSIVTTALLSAVLASGGTFAALRASGALDTTKAGTGGTAVTTAGAKVPVTIDESSAVIDAAAKTGPAIVRIFVTGTTTDPFGGTIPEQGVGSGIIFDPNGWILTNRHVVTDSNGGTASSLTVELKDGQQYEGKVYGIDTLTDLAIVKIKATGLTAATIGSSADLKVGELAIAIGSPLGTYSNSVTSGIVSATGRSVTVQNGDRLSNLIQTDAAINPGNSGGPLLDAVGDVIGINTAVATGSNGIGFAIPVDIARPIMQQALAGEPLARPYIGVRYEAITAQVQARDKLSTNEGAIVSRAQDGSGGSQAAVVPGGPADAAGVKEGDIIVAIGTQAIDTEHPLDLVLAGFSPGQTVDLKIIRGSATITLSVTLGTRPPNL